MTNSENFITLADGSKIDKATGEVIRDKPVAPTLLGEETKPVEVDDEDEDNSNEILEIKRRLPVNRHLNDLPGDVNSTRAVAIVVGLALFGLSDNEIAHVCGTEMSKIIAIKESERYQNVLSGIIDNVMRAQSDNIRQMFINNSRHAAEHIISGMQSKNPELRHAAAKEILDRGGFRPADIVEHRIKHEDALKIVYIKGDESKTTIDADYEDVS